ncbi:hypothetical protein ACGFYT_08055 [Streptomyces sp. NPDC048208]|uniref:hypothetical protein n=1 Tax=Streptomyces sp. NPDC048208 TaxID=3365515 RepID=UPI00371D3D40
MSNLKAFKVRGGQATEVPGAAVGWRDPDILQLADSMVELEGPRTFGEEPEEHERCREQGASSHQLALAAGTSILARRSKPPCLCLNGIPRASR